MSEVRWRHPRLNPIGLACTLVLPIATCESKEPPVIDTTTPIKNPVGPTTNPVTPQAPSAK
jgi:hypothetical protein